MPSAYIGTPAENVTRLSDDCYQAAADSFAVVPTSGPWRRRSPDRCRPLGRPRPNGPGFMDRVRCRRTHHQVQWRPRHRRAGGPKTRRQRQTVNADLDVDATGRGTRTPRVLAVHRTGAQRSRGRHVALRGWRRAPPRLPSDTSQSSATTGAPGQGLDPAAVTGDVGCSVWFGAGGGLDGASRDEHESEKRKR